MPVSRVSGQYRPINPQFSGTIRQRPSIQIGEEAAGRLDEDTFVRLAHSSGWDTEVQGAMGENKRLPFMVQPKPVVITAKQNGQVVGLAQGINYGEYAFLSALMIDQPFQKMGIGKDLIRVFRDTVEQQNGGPTSTATMSEDHRNTDTVSHNWYLKRGFRPLPNALFLERSIPLQ